MKIPSLGPSEIHASDERSSPRNSPLKYRNRPGDRTGIANQGNSVEEARNNLAEALELFFEHASESEIKKSHAKKDWRLYNNDPGPQA